MATTRTITSSHIVTSDGDYTYYSYSAQGDPVPTSFATLIEFTNPAQAFIAMRVTQTSGDYYDDIYVQNVTKSLLYWRSYPPASPGVNIMNHFFGLVDKDDKVRMAYATHTDIATNEFTAELWSYRVDGTLAEPSSVAGILKRIRSIQTNLKLVASL